MPLASPLLFTAALLSRAVFPTPVPTGCGGALTAASAVSAPRRTRPILLSDDGSAPGTKIAIRVKKPSVESAPPAAPASTGLADDTTVSIKVKAPTATAPPPPAAPSAPPRSEIDERLFQATQSANCTLLLDALLEGANPNLRDPNGRTGLHFMAGVGLAPACVLLIHFGADVNAKDKSNLAPIHMAAGYANAQCLRVLIAAGADTEARGEQGTALDVVERLGEYQLDQYLNRTGVEKITKKKDDKLEALKACALSLMEPERVREEEDWDQMLREVLRLVAV